MLSHRRLTLAAIARACACLIVFALANYGRDALALSFIVNTLADTSTGNTMSGSLRDGLNAINATTDLVNTIAFQPGINGTITLTAPLPLLLNNVAIDGTGANIAIDGASAYRIFFVGVDGSTAVSLQTQFPNSPLGRGSPLAVTLRKLTLQNGKAQGGTGAGGGMGAGGALFVNAAANVTIDSVAFIANKANGGAGGSGHAFAGGGGLGGNGMVDSILGGGGGGIFGNGGATAGGGVFGNGAYGGGGYSGAGGGAAANGIAGASSLAGMTGTGGGGFNGETGGSNGGGGGGDTSGGSGGGGYAADNGTSTQSGNGGFGGGGGGSGSVPANAHITGGSGGFGGGGGSTYYVANGVGGNGGFGGGGGGGSQTAGQTGGGAGGFGGGGGSGYGFHGGHGGFGGGGGNSYGGTGASGGFGGGAGGSLGSSNDGGGAGFGGAVFVMDGGTLTIQGNCLETGGVVTAGASGGTGAGMGSAAGSGIFLQGAGTLAFVSAIGQTQTISDAITDEVGSGIANPPSSGDFWGLTKSGAGTLVLGGANAYAGAVTVNGGILRITGNNAASVSTSVAASATLTGTGQITSVDLYGTMAPGTSQNRTGVLQVFHAVAMETGALTCFHADGAGNASRLLVTPDGGNPIGNGAAFLQGVARIDFSVGPMPGDYLLVSAGIIGTFSGFETNIPELTGQLKYSASQVTFTVIANDTIFGGSFEAPSASQSACAAAFSN